jgi:hypothetical protein
MPETVYAVRIYEFYKSADGGMTWRTIPLATEVHTVFTVALHPQIPGTLYAGTDAGVYKSVNGGETWSPSGSVPTPDTERPQTSIISATDGTGSALTNGGTTLSTALTLTFAGTDNVGVVRLECRLDGGGFNACSSPLSYNSLGIGSHTFEVRAVDTSSNPDDTPARFSWTVNPPPVNTPPETTITGAIDGRGRSIVNGGSTPSSSMRFSFAGTDNGSVTGFECRLDTASFAPCTSPVAYSSVNQGAHTFQVRAIDNNGARDPSPAAFSWRR